MNTGQQEPIKTDKPARTRTPRAYETIEKGALALPLIERAALRDKLIESVTQEKEALRAAADKLKDL